MISFSPVELVVRLVQNLKSVGIILGLGLALGFHAYSSCQGQEPNRPGTVSHQNTFAASWSEQVDAAAPPQNSFEPTGQAARKPTANPFTNIFAKAYENKPSQPILPQESLEPFDQAKNQLTSAAANALGWQPPSSPKTPADQIPQVVESVEPQKDTNAFVGSFDGAYKSPTVETQQNNSNQFEPSPVRLAKAATPSPEISLEIPGWSAPNPTVLQPARTGRNPNTEIEAATITLSAKTNQFEPADFEPPEFVSTATPTVPLAPPEDIKPEENSFIEIELVENKPTEISAEYQPRENQSAGNPLLWWKEQISTPTRAGGSSVQVETNGLVYMALARSPRIRALSQTPLIREQQVTEAQSAFDPVSFIQSQFQDRVDPVGDQLSVTNDGSDFLEDHIWTADLGVRKKTETGASVELSQRLGFRNSNSQFFSPQDQGTATLALNVTQPLMRGRGRYFNRSQILIAQSAGTAAWDTFVSELQDEVQTTVEAYWRLYFDRSVFLQKQRNVDRAKTILAKLEGRASLDSLPSQIARARSAVLSRRTELANAVRDIRNSETEIRRLTADSDWRSSQMIEMLPAEMPTSDGPEIGLEQVIVTALENRPEIRETLQRSKIAAIQRDISVNDLMPELSLLLGTYVSSLDGDSQLGSAWADQFSTKPGYSVGVEFELPIGNRAARSRLTQRKLQLNKIKSEVDETMQNVIAESQIALRRVSSARETLVAATEAIVAAQLDLEQNKGRWEAFALVEGDIAEGQTPTTILDQLLDSQERLSAAELVFAQAELELKTSETALQRTMGTLLVQRSVNFNQSNDGCVPVVNFSQQ